MTIRSTEAITRYKQKVAMRFSRAAESYDQYAVFQELVLSELMTRFAPNPNDSWVDIGTGTGRALEAMQSVQPQLSCVALDLSFEMLCQAQQRAAGVSLVCADAESLPFKNAAFDGILSSLAIQWCLHPDHLFKEWFRVLNDHGQVLVSTLVSGSMPELGKAWQLVDGRLHHNQYPELETLLNHCCDAGFKVAGAEQKTLTAYFDSVKEAVYSLKKVGASLVTESTDVVSPSRWKAFESAYQQQATDRGIPLSYEVAFIQLTKVDHG